MMRERVYRYVNKSLITSKRMGKYFYLLEIGFALFLYAIVNSNIKEGKEYPYRNLYEIHIIYLFILIGIHFICSIVANKVKKSKKYHVVTSAASLISCFLLYTATFNLTYWIMDKDNMSTFLFVILLDIVVFAGGMFDIWRRIYNRIPIEEKKKKRIAVIIGVIIVLPAIVLKVVGGSGRNKGKIAANILGEKNFMLILNYIFIIGNIFFIGYVLPNYVLCVYYEVKDMIQKKKTID